MNRDLSNKFQTLHEIVHAAHETLSQNIWDYLRGGTETETTLKRNRMALDAIALRPRVLRDMRKIDATKDVVVVFPCEPTTTMFLIRETI